MSTNIVILTGAGISAESGLETFRADDGMWNNYKVEEVATLEAFMEDPDLVQSFYNQRRAQLATVAPNNAHRALSALEQQWDGNVTIITQNVDDLHERAGSRNIIHMHGELLKARCIDTSLEYPWHGPIDESSKCECCNQFGTLRPHIVWFGEEPFHMDKIEQILSQADIFVSIGTSNQVYPAAGFIDYVRNLGTCHTIEINLEATCDEDIFHEGMYGLASQQVPELIGKLLATQ